MAKSTDDSRGKLLDAAVTVVRRKGYAAARVEDVCAEADLTKGSFFHHFSGKDELAIAAAAHFDKQFKERCEAAPYQILSDPVERLLAYVDFRKALFGEGLSECSCFAGTMVQEVYATHPELNAACERVISGHAKTLEADIRLAMARRGGVCDGWTARSLALHTQAVIQGACIVAKATGEARRATESLDHLRRYLELLFVSSPARRAPARSRKPR